MCMHGAVRSLATRLRAALAPVRPVPACRNDWEDSHAAFVWVAALSFILGFLVFLGFMAYVRKCVDRARGQRQALCHAVQKK